MRTIAYFALKCALRLCRAAKFHNVRHLTVDALGDIGWDGVKP